MPGRRALFFKILSCRARGRRRLKAAQRSNGREGADWLYRSGRRAVARRVGGGTSLAIVEDQGRCRRGESLINGQPYTIVGIGPQRFQGVNAIGGPDLWVPMMMYEQVLPAGLAPFLAEERRALMVQVAGRLKPDVTVNQAESNLKAIARNLEREYPQPNKGRTAAVQPLAQATIFPGLREQLVRGGAILMAVVGLVLLIACSNVANLLLARAAARRKEIAIRLSIGASRNRLIRQLLTESVLLALAAGGFGLLMAFWARDLIWSIRPPFLAQNALDLSLDRRVLAFTVVVSLATGLIFGLAPALQASRLGVVEELKEGVRTGFGPRRRRMSLKNGLVVAQVALSLVALVAAGLFLRSLAAAHAIDPGFDTEKLAVLTINPGQRGYDRARGEQLYRDLMDRMRTLPGVRSASLAVNLPLFGGFQRSVFLEDQPQEPGRGVLVQTNAIGEGYFQTAGVRVLSGRDFSEADREGAPGVAIINEAMAHRFWANQDPLGKRFRFFGDDFFHEVVGVAANAKYVTLGEDPQPCVHLPLAQNYSDVVTVYIRAESDPAAALGAARREVRAADPEIALTNTWTVGEVIGQSLWASRMAAWLLAVLGALALTLAAVGLYGVMAQWVSERHREMGIRLALGARRSDVMRLILSQGLALVGIGIALGLFVSSALSRAASNLLYGISPTDPLTYAYVSGLLVAVALLASSFPAYRAGRVDPLAALRRL